MASRQLPSTFKKLICTKISQKFRDVVTVTQEKLPNPGIGEVLVKNRFVGVNASDINYSAGRYDPNVKPPFDCGFEGVGEVAAVGPGSALSVGQPVTYSMFGAFSEFKSVPEKILVKLSKVSPDYLPLQVSGATAAIALDKLGDLKSGETVLITAAAGGTGQFAVQWAKRAGCHVIGTCSTDDKVEFLKKIGCDRPVNYKKESLKDVLKAEYRTGVDVVYESVGGDMFETCLNALKTHGRLIVIGFITDYKSDLGFKPTRTLATIPVRLLNKSASVRGFFLNHFAKDWNPYVRKMADMIEKKEIQSFIDMGESCPEGPFVGVEKIVDAVESDEIMSFVLFILKECGVADVPPLSQIKQFLQRKLKMEDMVQRNEDNDGNICWSINPTAMLKLHLANPDIAKHIKRYPTRQNWTVSAGQSSGSKWKTLQFNWAQDNKGRQFVRGDFVEFKIREEKVYGKIIQFLDDILEDKLCAKVEVYLDNSHSRVSEMQVEEGYLIKMNKFHTIPLDACQPYSVHQSFIELVEGQLVQMSEEKIEAVIQRSLLWKGLPIVNVPLNLFIDDLSANQSRRWSPLHAVQAQISGLSLPEKQRGKNVMFLGVSDTVPILQLLSPICEDIRRCTEFGVEAYDAFLGQKVVLTTDISLVITDYQMMSLACNHLGPSANKFCPKCFADESDPFKKWDARTPETTKRTMERLKLYSNKTLLQRETGVKEYQNCLWEYIDPHRDTPVGTLHFLYLGLAKHLIKFCLDSLNDHQKKLLELHLDAIDQTDFSYKINGSFFKYIDSRQGKDYKHYLQIAVLNMEFAGLQKAYLDILDRLALISKHMIQGCSSQELGNEVEQYLGKVKEIIPELGRKKKTHLGVHLSDDMERHGHPLEYVEDSFEKNHRTIRSSILHQNGHARSRDTANQFLNSELMGHVISGGFICDEHQNWKSAAEKVLNYGECRQILGYLGMPSDEKNGDNGTLKNIISKESVIDGVQDELNLLQAVLLCGGNPTIAQNVKVSEYKVCSIQNGAKAKLKSFVLYKTDEGDKNCVGQISKMIQLGWKGQRHQVIYIGKVARITTRDARYQQIRTNDDIEIIKPDNILELLHVVHDCKGGKCSLKEGIFQKKVEQELQSVNTTYIKHNNEHKIFIINKYRLTHSTEKFDF